MEIIGFDTGYFATALTHVHILPEAVIDAQHFGDVRDFPARLLHGVDAVIHLAAVSNDPMFTKFEQVTKDINQLASIRIASLAAAANVSNFVFASSCSMYGFADGGPRKESAPTNPLTAYARSKIGTEEALRQLDLA